MNEATMETTQKFQDLLKELFQFETSDLDFGIYRILNYKRDQIEKFIQEDLVNKVESAFAKHKDERLTNINQRFEEVKQKVIQSLGTQAFSPTGELKEEFKDTPLGEEYLSIKAQKDEAETIDEIKSQIFNDLYNFFSRFYEEGDFVPQYRYSVKGHKYAIPYNGEEVKLYWANNEQYYTKTGLLFRDYTFKADSYKIIFRTVSAKEELGSNKATKERFLDKHITCAKVVREIGEDIIDFLSQIEDFQKRLWEKKKFVLKTEYVITTDRVPEEFHEEIWKNKEQIKEWKELGFEIATPSARNDKKNVSLQGVPKDFGATKQSQDIALDDILDGLLIKSENWQALNVLLEKYQEKVKCIYIDPPYNTGTSEILYKNNYKHSSWLSLLENRLEIARKLLSNNGILCITIDHVELHNLRLLLQIIFGDENILGLISIKNNPSGRSTVKGFSIANEYAIFVGSSAIGLLPRTEAQIAQYDQEDTLGRFQWRNFLRAGGANDFRQARPRLYYPLIIKGNNVRIPEMEWKQELHSWVLMENPFKDEQIVYPIADGIEYTWRLGVESLNKRLSDIRVRYSRSGEPIIEIKFRIDNEGVLPKTVWDSKRYNATVYGTSLLRDIMGVPQAFPFPKSVYAVEDCIRVCGNSGDSYVLDFFAGSGTTAQAVINLNRQDGGGRKYILVEMGDYFDTVLIPRLKKVCYSFNWKGGKPQDIDGISQFFKYHILEQYEDTLDNIELTPNETAQNLFKDEYLLKYFLDYETRENPSLLNIEML